MGDFNCVLKGDERSFGVGASGSFANWVIERGPIALGFSGHKFNWNHHVNVDTKRLVRLNRGLYDDAWRWSFPMANIKTCLTRTLTTVHSCFSCNPDMGRGRKIDLSCSWQCGCDIKTSQRGWKKNGGGWQSYHCTQGFSLKLEAWNKDMFGNIFQRKKRNLLRLEGVQRSLERHVTEALLKLERRLKVESATPRAQWRTKLTSLSWEQQ